MFFQSSNFFSSAKELLEQHLNRKENHKKSSNPYSNEYDKSEYIPPGNKKETNTESEGTSFFFFQRFVINKFLS